MKINSALLIRLLGVGVGLAAVAALIAGALMPRPLISLGGAPSGNRPMTGYGSYGGNGVSNPANPNDVASGTYGMPSGAAESTDARKLMMPNPFTYKYVAAASLSDEPGKGRVYQLQLNGKPETVLQKLADGLGVNGEITQPEYSTPEYPTYTVGATDGTAPSISMGWNGTGNWWYNNPKAYPAAECLSWKVAEDGNKYCDRYEEQKYDSLPSKASLAKQAVKIFTAIGFDVDADDIQVSVSEWGSSAYASQKINGKESPLEWYIHWSFNGEISSVSGHSVTYVSRGDYETISAKSAVARMSDWRYSGQIPQVLWTKYQPTPKYRILNDESANKPLLVDPVPDASPEPKPAKPEILPAPEEPTTEPGPGIEPMPEPSPQIITVTVDRSVATQVMIWDKKGNPWLVPGYILFGEDWITPVFALEDGVVELSDPVEIMPMAKTAR